MQALRPTDSAFLSYVAAQEPQGAFLKQIADALKLSIQNAYRYARKLESKRLIRKDERGLYHILNDSQEATRVGYNRVTPKLQAKTIKQEPPEQATELHAFRAHYNIYPTSYSRAEATLSSLSIPFRRTGNPKHPTYTASWQGSSIRIGSRKLIVWGPKLLEPISITAEQLKAKALQANISVLVSFLQKTNIRVQETIDHQPLANVPYCELAIINNDAAEQYGRKHGYVPMAYDSNNMLVMWLDSTPQLTFETNRDKNHEQLRQWAQGIEDGVIRPYKDEMRHRNELAFHQQEIADIRSVVKDYGEKLKAHIPVLELAALLLKDSNSHRARVAKPYVDEKQARL